MALTASDLVSSAKKRTRGHRGRQKISDAALLDMLAGQDLMVAQMISQINADLLTTVEETDSVTLSENQSGYTLQDGMHYRDFTHINETDEAYEEIRIIRRADRDKQPSPPAAILQGTASGAKFYPVDPAGKRWLGSVEATWFNEDEGHKFSYSYVPTPGTLTALSDTLTSPNWARELLVTSLELSVLAGVDTGSFNQQQLASYELKVQQTAQRRQGALDSFRMQLYKFAHPQGLDALSEPPESDTEWVHDQVTG